MMTKNEMSWLYETMLCVPGMNTAVKVEFKIERRLALQLSQVIIRGLKPNKEDAEDLFSFLPAEATQALTQLANDCLEKAELTALSERLRKPYAK